MKKLLGIVVLGLLLSGNAYADHANQYSQPLDPNDKLIVLCKSHGVKNYRANEITHEQFKLEFSKLPNSHGCKWAISERYHSGLFLNIKYRFRVKNFEERPFTYLNGAYTNSSELKKILKNFYKLQNKKFNFGHSEISINNDYALYYKLYPTQQFASNNENKEKKIVTKVEETKTKVTKLKKSINKSYNSYSKILFKDDNQIHISMKYDWDSHKNALALAAKHCNSNNKKFAFRVSRPSFAQSRLDKEYKAQGLRPKSHRIFEYICSNQKISVAPSFASSAGSKIENGWNNYVENSNTTNNYSESTYSSQAKNSNPKTINFTIKDKKEQCEAIGFKPQTEKFADCVLRLVELDVKRQQSNVALSNNNSTNNAIAKQLEIQNKQLERQRYDEGTKFLFDLSRQLSQPQSSGWKTCSYIDLGGDMSKVKCR